MLPEMVRGGGSEILSTFRTMNSWAFLSREVMGIRNSESIFTGGGWQVEGGG